MELTLLAGRGVVGLVLIGAMTVLSLWSASRAEVAARADHADALAKGAQPPSLHPKIALDRCIGSGSCVQVCPENDVLALLDGKAAVVNPTSCIGHGECLRACPVDAIELVLGSERRGVDIPLVDADFQTNVPGLYVVDELGGMGLVYNAMTQALQCVSAVVKAGVPPRDAGVHQLVIVGAGPAGLAASLAAKAEGLDAVTVDQESVGGTVLHYPRHKIVMTKPVKLPLYGPLRLTEVSKEALLKTWQDILDKTGIEVRTGVRVGGVTRGDDDGSSTSPPARVLCGPTGWCWPWDAGARRASWGAQEKSRARSPTASSSPSATRETRSWWSVAATRRSRPPAPRARPGRGSTCPTGATASAASRRRTKRSWTRRSQRTR